MKTFKFPRIPRHPGTLAAVAAVLCLAAGSASASQLVYTPVDPSFGGNPLNGSFLISIASQGAQANAPNPLDGLAGLDLTTLGTSLDSLDKDINKLNGNICSQAGSNCPTTGASTNSLLNGNDPAIN
jgi:curli production assembly/transport component CsgF